MCLVNSEEPKPRAKFEKYWSVAGEHPIAYYLVRFIDDRVERWSGQTLLDNEMPIPLTPDFKTWEAATYSRKNCGRCWAALDGTLETLAVHFSESHDSHSRPLERKVA